MRGAPTLVGALFFFTPDADHLLGNTSWSLPNVERSATVREIRPRPCPPLVVSQRDDSRVA